MKEFVLRARQTFKKYDIEKSVYQTIAAVLVAGALVGGYHGYRWWSTNRIEQAQEAFSQAYQAFAQAAKVQPGAQVSDGERAMRWKSAQVAFETARDQHKRTSLTPFFNAFLARIIAQSGHDIAQASDLFAQVADAMKSASPYRVLYQIARVLVLLDGNQEQVQVGWRELERLANDDANVLQDMACYYAGVYLTAQGKDQQANVFWQKILSNKHVGAGHKESVWTSLARSYTTLAGTAVAGD